MTNQDHLLGSREASEALIRELYLDLRVRINQWASVTMQTAQARMGYVGQHLVSVVTGHPGGRSGARGKDLVIAPDRFAEIKTCYRVDQLGHCNKCNAAVAAVETACPACGSPDIDRKDDSKWLIGIRNDDEFEAILDPEHYYLVLFDFADLADPTQIRASIWRVDPASAGFALCMVDYYLNIRSNSTSKAPFNLWPYSLKFDLMKPVLVYQSLIDVDTSDIATQVFPPTEVAASMSPLFEYSSSRNLTLDTANLLARRLGLAASSTRAKPARLEEIQRALDAKSISHDAVADALAWAMYSPVVSSKLDEIPAGLRERIRVLVA